MRRSDSSIKNHSLNEFHMCSRLSGLSPFMGDNDTETMSNVCAGEWDFDTEDDFFDDVSDMAKNFIKELLVMNPK